MTPDPALGFLSEPPLTPEIRSSYEGDVASLGFVMNLSRTWAHSPRAHDVLFGLLDDMVHLGGLTYRQRAVLVTAAAAQAGDSYCALAWGRRLAKEAGPEVAGAVLTGTGRDDGAASDEELDAKDAALAAWARAVARDANETTEADLEPLRASGFDDTQIFAITVFVALRRAFSMVNASLGIQPDRQLRTDTPPQVSDAVTFGRPAAEVDSADIAPT